VRVSVTRAGAAGLDDAVVVCVRDDGKGLGPAAAQVDGQFGVAGMRERVQALGGAFAISGAPGQGVTVRAVLPVAAAERAAPIETRA
jgi:signal transduction histidine kinase